MKTLDEEFDSKEFHTDFYGRLVDAARSGHSPEDAWLLIGAYVDWVEGCPSSSPVVKYIADFLGELLEIKASAGTSPASKDELPAALSLLGIVRGQGQPAASLDQILRRLAAVMLLTRPTSEGGRALRIGAARDLLERQHGLGAFRLRDLQSENPEMWSDLKLAPSEELHALVAGDGSEKSLISH